MRAFQIVNTSFVKDLFGSHNNRAEIIKRRKRIMKNRKQTIVKKNKVVNVESRIYKKWRRKKW